MRYLFLSLLLTATLCDAQIDSLDQRLLRVADMQSDFALYRKLLEETHPGLYRYTARELMQAKMDSIYGSLLQPMHHYDFYRTILMLTKSIRCAHTYSMPTPDYRKHLNAIKTLPFYLYPIQGKLYVVFNGSTDQTVSLGYELLAINNHPVDSVAAVLKSHFWVDGYSELPKNAVLKGSSFCYFYYTLIERTDQFDLLFRDLEGKEIRLRVPAQNFSLSEKQFIQSSVNKKAVSLYNRSFKTPWRLSFLEDVASTAVLRFDGFGGKGINSVKKARAAMHQFMNESLKTIHQKNIKNLIIDVRDNSGGWDVQGIELFSYLVKGDRPFRYYQRAHAATNDSDFLKYADLSALDRKNVKSELKPEPDGTFSLREEKSPDLQWQQPQPNRFKGNVFVLMNEGTASAAAEFVALCKSNNVGVMVGSEAGGAYEGGNGSSFITLRLPHSKIQVHTPLVSYQNAVTPLPTKGRGTMPDHWVVMQWEDLLTRKDRPLEFVKDLIRKQVQ